MEDICDLILRDHDEFRSEFARLFDQQRKAEPTQLADHWTPLAEQLGRHAGAEEVTFYPGLLRDDTHAADETKDAIKDHNKIRDAVRAAKEAEVGSDDWWSAVTRARKENDDHMKEEEEGPIPDFRRYASDDERARMAQAFQQYKQEHAGANVDETDKDPDEFVEFNEK